MLGRSLEYNWFFNQANENDKYIKRNETEARCQNLMRLMSLFGVASAVI